MKQTHHSFNDLCKEKAPSPFSLRLPFEERAKLEAAANGVPLGTYIKAVLLEDNLEEVRRRNTRPLADTLPSQERCQRLVTLRGIGDDEASIPFGFS